MDVLIVDDSRLARRRAAEPLSSAGARVREAGDPAEALDRIDEDPPDAVVVNADLPGRAAQEIVDALAGRERPPAVVVATAREGEHGLSLAEGAVVDVLDKDQLYGVRVTAAVQRGVLLAGEPDVEVDAGEPGRVLVVDDSPIIRRVVADVLEEAETPLVVEEAEDDEPALERVRGERFDALLIDHVLPGMAGAELLEVLRAEGIETPAMALTGQRDPAVAERFLAAGALGVWTKEHEEPRRLRTLVEQLVRLGRAEAGGRSPATVDA